MPDADSDLPRLEASEVQSPLERALAVEHAYIRELATRAEQARPTDEDPRLHCGLTDTFSAVLSRHLAAVDDVLLPRARRELTHGHAKVHDYVRHARGLENTLHLLKVRLYGDATAQHRTWGEVWNGLEDWLDDHVTHEQALMHALAEHLTAEQAQRLAAKLPAAEAHSPTRPHPYTPHTGVLGRIARSTTTERSPAGRGHCSSLGTLRRNRSSMDQSRSRSASRSTTSKPHVTSAAPRFTHNPRLHWLLTISS